MNSKGSPKTELQGVLTKFQVLGGDRYESYSQSASYYASKNLPENHTWWKELLDTASDAYEDEVENSKYTFDDEGCIIGFANAAIGKLVINSVNEASRLIDSYEAYLKEHDPKKYEVFKHKHFSHPK